jgi:hypothetical protein
MTHAISRSFHFLSSSHCILHPTSVTHSLVISQTVTTYCYCSKPSTLRSPYLLPNLYTALFCFAHIQQFLNPMQCPLPLTPWFVFNLGSSVHHSKSSTYSLTILSRKRVTFKANFPPLFSVCKPRCRKHNHMTWFHFKFMSTKLWKILMALMSYIHNTK